MPPTWIIEPFAKDRHNRTGFSCGNSELDTYLHKSVSPALKYGSAAVFVMTEEGQQAVRGYYTLSNTSIIPADIPEDQRRRLRANPVPATLIGRIEHDGTLPELLPVMLIDPKPRSDSEGSRRPSFGGLARNGVFELQGLTAGTYQVFVAWHDFTTRTMWGSQRREVTLVAGASSDVMIEVRSSTR